MDWRRNASLASAEDSLSKRTSITVNVNQVDGESGNVHVVVRLRLIEHQSVTWMTECVTWMWHLSVSFDRMTPSCFYDACSKQQTWNWVIWSPGHRVIILTRCETRVFPVFEEKPKVKIRWLSGRVVKFESSTQRQVIRKIKVWIQNIKKQQRIWGWCQHVINIALLIKMRIYICG